MRFEGVTNMELHRCFVGWSLSQSFWCEPPIKFLTDYNGIDKHNQHQVLMYKTSVLCDSVQSL